MDRITRIYIGASRHLDAAFVHEDPGAVVQPHHHTGDDGVATALVLTLEHLHFKASTGADAHGSVAIDSRTLMIELLLRSPTLLDVRISRNSALLVFVAVPTALTIHHGAL